MPTKCYKHGLRVLQFHYANMNPSIKNHFSLLLLATIFLLMMHNMAIYQIRNILCNIRRVVSNTLYDEIPRSDKLPDLRCPAYP